MSKFIEQRICIKFCVKNEINRSMTIQMLQKAFGENCLSRSRVLEWYRLFQEGRDSVEDDPRSGRPSTSTDDVHIESVKNLIMSDRRLTVREIATDVGISFGSCHSILTNNLQRDKYKEMKKEKDMKDPMKKNTILRDLKGSKDIDKEKEEFRKYVKDIRKDYKSSKRKSKGKDDPEETASNGKKERKDSDSIRESLKRGPKRPTRQSMDSTSKASSSPRDTPPPKRRRI